MPIATKHILAGSFEMVLTLCTMLWHFGCHSLLDAVTYGLKEHTMVLSSLL